MSHEIRTPLSGIVGMLDILRASGLPAEQTDHAEVADRCAKDLIALVNDILDFSKMEAGAMVVESIDFRPREVIARAADVLAPQARAKGLTVQTSVDPALDTALRGDPARLRQILLNLISNAVKFTETGEVEVGAAVAERDGATVVRYWVRDTGIGLSPRAKQRLFLPFEQADGSTTRKYGGTGLGLAISKQLVELMAGEFGVESIEGQGSTFWFTLPLLPGSEARLLQSALPQHQPAAASTFAARFVTPPRVLVAEDNDVNQRIARLQMRRIGIDPIVASNGREAIEAFQESRPDIILMDCQMPGVDGFEATRAIRRLERGSGTRVPIVAMTANAVHGDQETCLAAGMDDYLAKPVSFDGIQRALGAWLPEFAAEAGDGGPNAVATGAEIEERTMTILEAETLTALQALSDDNDDLLQELVDIYLAEAPALIRAIRAASAEGDAEGLERAAHSLKGSSANMGALRLASKALALEELGRAGRIDGASEIGGRTGCSVRGSERGSDRLAERRVAKDRPVRILIAEDQLLERRILETGLRKSGHDVESFADGESAWERFREEPARLVITDWVMPRMNGVDLIQRIRAADSERHTYTILLTSRGDKDDVVDGLASGADDYLTKPFDHRELAARVEIGKRMIQLEDSLLATQEHLERLATYDSLTGLLNRQSVLERAGVELRRAWRTGGRMGLVMVDVDRFKDVNDRHGHAQGDSVLKAVAASLALHTRPYDLVGRWGGEEFLIALPGADVEEARQVAERSAWASRSCG